MADPGLSELGAKIPRISEVQATELRTKAEGIRETNRIYAHGLEVSVDNWLKGEDQIGAAEQLKWTVEALLAKGDKLLPEERALFFNTVRDNVGGEQNSPERVDKLFHLACVAGSVQGVSSRGERLDRGYGFYLEQVIPEVKAQIEATGLERSQVDAALSTFDAIVEEIKPAA